VLRLWTTSSLLAVAVAAEPTLAAVALVDSSRVRPSPLHRVDQHRFPSERAAPEAAVAFRDRKVAMVKAALSVR